MSPSEATSARFTLRKLIRPRPPQRGPEDTFDQIVAAASAHADRCLLAEVERLLAIHEDHPDHVRLLGGGTARHGDITGSAADLEHLIGLSGAGASGRLHAHTTHLLKRAIGHTDARLHAAADEPTRREERARLRRLHAWATGAAPILTPHERQRIRNSIGHEADMLTELIGAEMRRSAAAGDHDRAAKFATVVRGRIAAGRLALTLRDAHAAVSHPRASTASAGVSGRRPA